MGWTVSVKETKKGKQYKIKSSVSGKFITKWLYKDEITKFLFWHRFMDFTNKFIEDAMSFPHGYFNDDGERYIDDSINNFFDARIKMIKDDKLMWQTFIDETKKLGINIDVSDGTYFVNNNEN
jgi:hypothetical protein